MRMQVQRKFGCRFEGIKSGAPLKSFDNFAGRPAHWTVDLRDCAMRLQVGVPGACVPSKEPEKNAPKVSERNEEPRVSRTLNRE